MYLDSGNVDLMGGYRFSQVHSHHVRMLLVVAALAALLVAGCGGPSGPPPSTGPLVFMNQGGSTVGMDIPNDGRYRSDGTLMVTNHDLNQDAVLIGIRLGGEEHLSIRAAYVVPVINESRYGGGLRVPPITGEDPVNDEQWAARQDLVGYQVVPGEDANILVVLGTDDPCGGMFDWYELDYTVGGRQYTTVALLGALMENETDPNCEPPED